MIHVQELREVFRAFFQRHVMNPQFGDVKMQTVSPESFWCDRPS